MEPQDQFIEKLNKYLPTVDFDSLDASCNSRDQTYAKEVLGKLHSFVRESYGTDTLYDRELGMVDLPAVIRNKANGRMHIGIVMVDLSSSGEHWGTSVLSPFGVLSAHGQKLTPAERQYLKEEVGSYDYWYTAQLPGDIHVRFDHVPAQVQTLLDHCQTMAEQSGATEPELKM